MTDASTDTSNRAHEHEVLSRFTTELDAAYRAGDMGGVARALSAVQTLWQVFITEVTDDRNPLPPALRGQIANVGMTVLREIAGKAPNDVDVEFIVEVNQAIADGLAPRGP